MERRPIKSRSTRWARTISGFLGRTGITPNAISVIGVFAAAGAGACLWGTGRTGEGWNRILWLLGAGLVQLRLLCNMLDGMVATETGRTTPVGDMYNEVPDRIADALILAGAGYAAGGDVVLGFSAACAALFTAYVRAQAIAAGAPNDFCGPMAKPHRMAVVTAAALYMAAAPAAWRLHWGPGGAWGVMAAALLAILAGTLWTSVRRLRRAARALRERS